MRTADHNHERVTMPTNTADAPHRSTQRVLRILEVLSRTDEGLTMAEICRTLQAPKSSLFPIIHTMAEEGYISYDETTNHYRIGFKTYLAGKAYVRGQDAVSVLAAQLQRIVYASGETCQAGILSGDKVLYIAKVDSPQPVRLFSDIGRALPIYCTAIGKALVCEREHGELHALLGDDFQPYTSRTYRTFEGLWEELQIVREEGIAHDRGEMTDSIECIAAPIHVDGKIQYGIGISVPSYRLTIEKTAEFTKLLKEATAYLETVLS